MNDLFVSYAEETDLGRPIENQFEDGVCLGLSFLVNPFRSISSISIIPTNNRNAILLSQIM